MPALFVWFFGAGGVVWPAREARTDIGEFGRTPRIVAALAVLVVAITPALIGLSQLSLNRAGTRARRDCPTAIDAALTATERFGTRPEPWRILATATRGSATIRARAARHGRGARRDPDNWQLAYGQAIVHGVAGQDPLPFAERPCG